MSRPDRPKIPFMVDIETYDVTPSSVILSIGGYLIHPDTEINPQDTFYVELSTATQFERTASQSTIDWWADQEAAGMPCPRHGVVSLRGGLQMFADWLTSYQCQPIIWCKGTDFDTAILSNAFKQSGIPVPWRYSDVRDFRTALKMFTQNTSGKPSHNALDDARVQATVLQDMARLYNLCLV